MKRINQRGALLGFIVVGVILIGLLVGGVYFVSRQSAPAPTPTSTTTPAPTKQPENKPENTSAVDTRQQQAAQAAPQAAPETAVQLPHTGPTEAIGSVVALGFLSLTTLSYLRSRRQLASL